MKVTYRATFQQPIGKLNPLGLKLKSEIHVELYEIPGHCWSAREIDTADRNTFPDLRRLSSLEAAQREVAASFAEQLTGWTMHDPSRTGDPVLFPDEIMQLPGGTVVRKPPMHYTDRQISEAARTARSACGKTVAATVINQGPPTCEVCRAAYEQDQRRGATA